MEKEDIKVNVTFTDGYQKRFTEACIRQLERRKNCQELKNAAPEPTKENFTPQISA